MKGKVLLAGGGGAQDSLQLDQRLAAWIGTGGTMLYLPIALRGLRSFDACMDWITETFSPLQVSNIRMWTDLAEHRAAELQEFDAIYIGGGNTYSLLAQLRESGFDRHLIDYAAHGGILYGGSAGAVILGRDIQTVSHVDLNAINLTDTRGLDLAAGCSVWVHYQTEDDTLINKYLKEENHAVIAISDRSGVLIDNSGMESLGPVPAYCIDENGKRKI